MKNIIVKINLIFIFVILFICISSINSIVNAANTIDDIITNGDSFISAGEDNDILDTGGLQELSKFISGVLLVVAIGVALLSGVVMGIKFITQSIEDKAKIKESMVPWIVGIIVSLGAFAIWEVAVNIFSNI